MSDPSSGKPGRPENPPVQVVAGIVVESQRVLLAQRSRSRSFPLLWEFPGGKVEPGETPEAALVREFGEELGIEIEPLATYGTIEYLGRDGKNVRVVFFRARRKDGEPRPLDVEAVTWATARELGTLDIIPANRTIVDQLQKELEAGTFSNTRARRSGKTKASRRGA
jgi:8-oxo-dGTP diphosphatase